MGVVLDDLRKVALEAGFIFHELSSETIEYLFLRIALKYTDELNGSYLECSGIQCDDELSALDLTYRLLFNTPMTLLFKDLFDGWHGVELPNALHAEVLFKNNHFGFPFYLIDHEINWLLEYNEDCPALITCGSAIPEMEALKKELRIENIYSLPK